jgi:Zn-dependent hydrolases, including glyoxylases
MRFTQYYLDCLSQASYLVADETTGSAALIDPRRDIDEYVADAQEAGLRIEYVIETHFHADFLSGHLELAAATGAEIVFGDAATPDFPIRRVADGERIALGDVVLEFLSTPGHTPESISVVVWEHADDPVPYGVLTGDTLFIGDVGRPDLLGSQGRTADDMARALYESLHTKLLVLPDETRLFPAHGAGSACGKQLSTATQSTLGEQRRTNYALQPMDVEEFVAAVTDGLTAPPPYFPVDAHLNRTQHDLLDKSPPPPLTLEEVLAHQRGGAVVVDTRDAAESAAGHLRGSINVGLAGRYAEFAGSVVASDRDLVLVCASGEEREAKIRLGRIGYDRVIGHLAEPEVALSAAPEHTARASRLTASELAQRLSGPNDVVIVDVRSASEREGGAIEGSLPIPLGALRDRLADLPLERPVVVYCAGGYRSSIAASVLRAAGGTDVSDLLGGYPAWSAVEGLR